MTDATSAGPIIEVTGDVHTETYVFSSVPVQQLGFGYLWERQAEIGVSVQPGAAALQLAMLRTVAEQRDLVVRGEILGPPVSVSVFSHWAPFPVTIGERTLAWRIREPLGESVGNAGWISSADGGDPDCLIIDDRVLGFRDSPDRWPVSLIAGRPRHIVLKMFSPLATGPLWEHLLTNHADRLTVVVNHNDIRKHGWLIGQSLSWEKTSSEITEAARADRRFDGVARLIIRNGLVGAVLLDAGSARLVYDPAHQEGAWGEKRPGIVTGQTLCLATALALECLEHPEAPEWSSAIVHGLTAGRWLHDTGYLGQDGGLRLPPDLARVLSDPPATPEFHVAEIEERRGWTILEQIKTDSVEALAEQLVVRGADDVLADVPVERLGAWLSVDRTEIESIRSMRAILEEFLAQRQRVRPLSLAVFGPPGSGKSFAVKQLANGLKSRAPIEIVEFNLAQFNGPADLMAALQRVRDVIVQSKLPLVFWDEFDSPLDGQPLGWLKLFLAPMQDASFTDSGIVRPLGPAIFVFAGGTYHRMSAFKAAAASDPATKATDFLSRLRAYVDVLGINPAEPRDRMACIRRALLLRSVLRPRASWLFQGERLAIDPGVVRAFLQTGTFLHGARSLEAIVEMSNLSGKGMYELSSLPAGHQLDLHTDGATFLALAQGTPDESLGLEH